MTIKTIGKNRGNVFIWLALLVFSLIMPCVALAADTLIKVEEQPQNASRWRGTSSGAAIIAVVTGGTGGAVWGGDKKTTPYYTDDSSISTAAVHAGALQSGETGLVAITILPGMPIYTGSEDHGVSTKSYGSYDGSYSIKAYSYDIDTTVIADPGNFARWGNFADWKTVATKTFKVRLIGVNSGSIWGTDTYTSDSLLALAAVHAKALSAAGIHGDVSVTLSAGRDSYIGSTQNGVSSSSWGSYGSSYTFAAGAGCTATIDKNLLLHIPFCTYGDKVFGTMSLWIDLVYEFRPLENVPPVFKLINYGNNDAGATCSDPAATLSSELQIDIPEVLFPDGNKHYDMVLKYSSSGGGDGYVYFDYISSSDTP
ncbi:MAG: LCCL domain-containing protein [Deltaproteobacteria bacterium]